MNWGSPATGVPGTSFPFWGIFVMLNLRELAEKIEPVDFIGYDDVKALQLAADRAEQFAFDLDSLVDGKDDELGKLLSPVVEFLRKLAGIPVNG